jgi:hypothetical protein
LTLAEKWTLIACCEGLGSNANLMWSLLPTTNDLFCSTFEDQIT